MTYNFKAQVQTSDGTNLILTHLGQYKHRTRTKNRTSTNVGQYKRRTSTNDGPVQTSDQYKRQTKENII